MAIRERVEIWSDGESFYVAAQAEGPPTETAAIEKAANDMLAAAFAVLPVVEYWRVPPMLRSAVNFETGERWALARARGWFV
jgi:hypothetical protein